MSLFETLKLPFVYLYIFELCFPPVLILPLDYVFHLAQNVSGNYSKLDVNKYILSDICNIIGLIEPITRFGIWNMLQVDPHREDISYITLAYGFNFSRIMR